MQYYIGCSGWSYSAWQGPFYPSDMDNNSNWLSYYASVFDYVEIDSSFYSYHNLFMLFAILIFAVFAVIMLVAYISGSRPNLLMAASGLSNGVFSSDNTPIERNISAAPIITTTKNSTLSIISTIPLGYGEPESIAVNPKTNTIYSVTTHYDIPSSLNSTTYKNNIVTIIDGKTNKVTRTITVGDGYKGISIHQLDDNSTTNFVAVIDGQTNKIIKNITLPKPAGTEGYSKGIAINPQTNRLYVDDGGKAGLVVIDTSKNQVIGSLKEISGPNSISVNSNANRVYAINSDYNGNNHPMSNMTTSKLFSIDGNSNKILSILNLNTILKNIAVNPAICFDLLSVTDPPISDTHFIIPFKTQKCD